MVQLIPDTYQDLLTAEDLADGPIDGLPDRYRVIREIGSGGMSVVYLAQDEELGREVAIKVLKRELALAGPMSRFVQEIEITARLDHPNILPQIASGNANGSLYYVMPYVETGSLRDRLNREKILSLNDVLHITAGLAEALDYAHSCQLTIGEGVVHRDIKPENILLKGDGEVLLADFGIARIVSRADSQTLTSYGLQLGTWPYMSPEQCKGVSTIDGRSDVYSLACVVYEMLAGETPFSGSGPAVAAKHIGQVAPSLRVMRPDLPESVVAAVGKALAKAPADRFASASGFVKALRARVMVPVKPWQVAAAGAVIALTGLGTWTALRPPAVPLDENKVVVFPLVEHNPGKGREGNEVALLLGSALEHTDPLRWIDGWTWLDSARRTDAGAITPLVARRISRDRKARFYIEGSILRLSTSTTVILRLYDAAGDSLLAQTSASAPTDQAAALDLGLRAMNEMLPRLLEPGRKVDLRALAERRPAALANWIQGEKAYRESHFQTALGYYRRAFEADSGLALAAVKATQAAIWALDTAHIPGLLDTALRHDAMLPPKYMHLARGLRFFLVGAADSAVTRIRQALSYDPAWADASMMLGEVYYHLLPQGYALDSLAEAAFIEARRSDREFAPSLFHLAEINIRRGDVDSAERMVAAFERSAPDTGLAMQLRLMLRCARNPAFDWREAAQTRPDIVKNAAKELSSSFRFRGCAEAGFRALGQSTTANLSNRWAAVLGLQALLLAEGRHAAAQMTIDSAISAGLWFASVLYVADAVAGGGMEGPAATVVARLGERFDTMSSRSVWQYGIWAAHRGDTAKVATAATVFAQHARERHSALDQLLGESMLARLDLFRGDTSAAIDRLRRLVPVGPDAEIRWRPWEPLADERMLLARLLLARGADEEAEKVAGNFDHPWPVAFLPYLPASLALRIEAAGRQGRVERVAKYRERLGALGRGAY